MDASENIRRHGPLEPSNWIRRWLPAIRPGGRVLDVACGRGRHLRYALAAGYSLTGIDRDLAAVMDLHGRPNVELIAADLEDGRPFPLSGRKFDGVIVTNYLHRPLFPALAEAVGDEGVLIYETFAFGQERLQTGPSNPDFLLRPNELALAFADRLHLVAFEHGRVTCRSERIAQRIVAVGRAHRWVTAPPALDGTGGD